MAEQQVTETKLVAYAGIKVTTVQKNGTEGQKIAVSLFDEDRNGSLDEKEAECFNRYIFSSKPNQLTMYKNINGEKQTTVIKYDNVEDLKDSSISSNGNLQFYWDKRYVDKNFFTWNSGVGIDAYYKKATIDISNKKATIEGNGRNGHDKSIQGWGIELNLNNVDVKTIDFNDGTLNLQKVSDKGFLWDSPTEIETCRNCGTEIVVHKDSDSVFKMNPYS